MFKELCNEVKLTFLLYTKSPLSIQTQKKNVMEPALPDMQCIRSRYQGEDTVIIPGSSLKGVIRSRYEQIASLFGGTCCNVVDRLNACREPKSMPEKNRGKAVYDGLCPACKLFGSTAIGARLRIADAYPVKEVVIGERTGVGINRITGAAQRGALYQYEVVEEGTFAVEIFLKNYELYQLVLLLHVLNDMNDGYVSLGSATSRGNGQLEVQKLCITFREYRKKITGLKGIDGEEVLLNSGTFPVNYSWMGFYGESVFQDVSLIEFIKELDQVKIKEKLVKSKGVGEENVR